MGTPLTIACFLWQRNTTGFQLPSKVDYGPEHVRRLGNGLKRHLSIPHNFVCITDQVEAVQAVGVATIPLWDKCRYLGGCFNRLYTFSSDMRDTLGERFACIDIDAVVVSDVTHLFTRSEDFLINRYIPSPKGDQAPEQGYNGGLYMMDAGARSVVWDTFDPVSSPLSIEAAAGRVVGTDQAWARMVLGPNEATWGPEDGVYEARSIGHKPLPDNACLVFFAGRRDPSVCGHKWVRENWL